MKKIERFDGAQWSAHETPDATFILTNAGRVLLENNGVYDTLQAYMDDAAHGRESPDATRHYLAQGGNAVVYSVGNEPIAVKEKSAKSHDDLLPALERMDYIADAVEKHCPHWITVPAHYGVVIPTEKPEEQLLFMRKVDGGVTVGDVINAAEGAVPRETRLGVTIDTLFGGVGEEFGRDLKAQHVEMRHLVREALYAEGLPPDSFLVDFDKNPYNTLVEALPTPIGSSWLRMSIIDQ